MKKQHVPPLAGLLLIAFFAVFPFVYSATDYPYIMGVLIAAGIDHGVLRVAPAAPRHIFPPAIAVGD